jgi:hypothetical protein
MACTDGKQHSAPLHADVTLPPLVCSTALLLHTGVRLPASCGERQLSRAFGHQREPPLLQSMLPVPLRSIYLRVIC